LYRLAKTTDNNKWAGAHSRNKWAHASSRTEFKISVTPYLSKLTSLSLHALTPRQPLHVLTSSQPLPISSFSFLTPYRLFSPLCSLGVQQHERLSSCPWSRSACVLRCHHSPLPLLEAAARGRRRRPRQGKSRSKKEKSPSGLSGRKCGSMAVTSCSCRGCTIVAPTLLLFSNQRRLEAAHASRPDSRKLSFPSLFLLFLLCGPSLLLLFLLRRGGAMRGGGLWHTRWWLATWLCSAPTHEQLHDGSSSTASSTAETATLRWRVWIWRRYLGLRGLAHF
jgi:hypothetical protein